MNSGKTSRMLMMRNNLLEANRQSLLLRPKTDTRNEKLVTRIGLSAPVDFVIDNNHDKRVVALQMITMQIHKHDIDTVFIDEVQFMNKDFLYSLTELCIKNDVNIFACGLLTDFFGNMFDGSIAATTSATSLIECKTLCQLCAKHKATRHILYKNGVPVNIYEAHDDNIFIGNNEYKSVCHECFLKEYGSISNE